MTLVLLVMLQLRIAVDVPQISQNFLLPSVDKPYHLDGFKELIVTALVYCSVLLHRTVAVVVRLDAGPADGRTQVGGPADRG